MKCTNCQNAEATYTENCLVVEHTSEKFLSQLRISERLTGTKTVGLCDKCRRKAAFNRKDRTKVGFWTEIFSVVAIAGGVFFILMGLSVSSEEGTRPWVGYLVGGTIAGAGVIALILLLIVFPIYLNKKKQYVFIPWASTGKEIYVPYKKSYYNNKLSFDRINNTLLKGTSEKIYKLIESDGLLAIMLASALSQSDDSSDDSAASE